LISKGFCAVDQTTCDVSVHSRRQSAASGRIGTRAHQVRAGKKRQSPYILVARRWRASAPLWRIPEAEIRDRNDPCALSQHRSIDYRYRRRTCEPRICRGRRFGAVDKGRQAARALAVSASTRLPLLPDVLPFSEAADAPDFEAVSWHILFAPASTPQNIVGRLHAEMARIMAAPAMQKHVADPGAYPIRFAHDRGHQDISRKRAREMGRTGEEAWPRRITVTLRGSAGRRPQGPALHQRRNARPAHPGAGWGGGHGCSCYYFTAKT
jgi:Tripartite tricarboxylate transporter family receptor